MLGIAAVETEVQLQPNADAPTALRFAFWSGVALYLVACATVLLYQPALFARSFNRGATMMEIVANRFGSRAATRVASRRLVLVVGGTAMLMGVKLPGTSHAQAPSAAVGVGILWIGTPPLETHRGIAAFRRGLQEVGYTEGRSVYFEYRGAQGKEQRLDALAAELVHAKVATILAGATSAALAAKRATSNIPIVFCAVSADPVQSGLVASLGRPGGNATGTVLLAPELNAKRLELLAQALPGRPRVAVLWIPDYPLHHEAARETEDASRRLNIDIVRVESRGPDDLELALRKARRAGATALLALGAPQYAAMRALLADTALRHRLPAMAPEVGFADAGGLLEYGPDIVQSWHRAAAYVDKILKGARPADLPVEQPTEIHLTVNLKTARALGLTVSPSFLARAHKVIE
jgi:putative ABC transport system substrate-binding protein